MAFIMAKNVHINPIGEDMTFVNQAYSGLSLISVEESQLPLAQAIFDHNQAYHNGIVHRQAGDMAKQCFESPAPEVKDSRVYKYFLLVVDKNISDKPIAVVDIFVGFPHYKIASIGALLVHEKYHRKGIASKILKALEAFLRDHHPATTTLSISITDNNIPALRFLVKNEFKRMDHAFKHEVDKKTYVIVTFRHTFKS